MALPEINTHNSSGFGELTPAIRQRVLDGRAGIYYALQRGVAEAVLALKLIEARLGARIV